MALGILTLDCTPPAHHFLRLPPTVVVAQGQPQVLRLALPGRLGVSVRGPAGSLRVDGSAPPAPGGWRLVPGAAVGLDAERPGIYTLGFRLFGFLPWRSLRVEAVPVPSVTPGGQSVGIVLHNVGPLIVRLAPVPGRGGPVPSPAALAGLAPGDYVLAVNGAPVATASALAAVVAASDGRPVAVTVLLRSGRQASVQVHPAWDGPAGHYAIGAWVRDQGSGIGTLTFVAGGSGRWGALGHPVVDPTTGQALAFRVGWLLQSIISGLQPSRDGRPGEKEGTLVGGEPPLGTVTANSAVGVFGRDAARPLAGGGEMLGALPVALEDQVHPGPATMWTVLHGDLVASFAIRIVAVLPQRRVAAKGLVLQVTDPRLLAETGGIVQGMSGSPIIQDGRLVGAVTHVLIDDPSRGYGVLAVWMAEEAHLVGPVAGQAV